MKSNVCATQRIGFACAGLRPVNDSSARWLGYLLNGKLQGKLLSAYKISQASPGTHDMMKERGGLQIFAGDEMAEYSRFTS